MTGSEHTIEEEEPAAFSLYINSIAAGDQICDRYMPLSAENLYERLSDGVVLTRLINNVKANTIDERRLNKQATMSVYQRNENLNEVIRAARVIGCVVVNIGAEDIAKQKCVLQLLIHFFISIHVDL